MPARWDIRRWACRWAPADCVETIAAGMGFDLCARMLHGRYPSHLVIPADGSRVMVSEVFRLAREEGDQLCCQLVDNAAEALAQLVMNLVRMSDPEAVVMGGSVMSDGYLLEQMSRRLQPETMRFVTRGVRLTALDSRMIGLLGAAVVAMDE